MFSRIQITKSTASYFRQIERLREEVRTAEAIVIGAGAGLSASAGFTYSGRRFDEHFSDFREKYGITDMYTGGFYPYPTPEEYWAWWSRHIYWNRYDQPVGKPYADLLELVKGKDYFVLTTNVDHQFQLSGFGKSRLFYMQGDYGLWQCAKPCHQQTYDNESIVRQMLEQQKDMHIPTELIPRCPVCGGPMSMNLRCDSTFVQDEGWYTAQQRYENYLQAHRNQRLLFLELGVGWNTPGIIKIPFWQMTAENPKAVYACINVGDASCCNEIENQAICIDADIGRSLSDILHV